MSTKKEMVFDVVLQSPGITESEIAKVLYGPSGYQQQVNKEIRDLQQDGLIYKSRRPSDGKNGLFENRLISPEEAEELSNLRAEEIIRAKEPLTSQVIHEAPNPDKDPYTVLREASEPSLLDRQGINNTAPQLPGIYWLLQEKPYPRYIGKTIILKIGMSKGDLRKELLNHLSQHVAAKRVKRIQNEEGVDVFFSFLCTSSNRAKDYETVLLKQFEEKHIDLPLLNRQGGIPRG